MPYPLSDTPTECGRIPHIPLSLEPILLLQRVHLLDVLLLRLLVRQALIRDFLPFVVFRFTLTTTHASSQLLALSVVRKKWERASRGAGEEDAPLDRTCPAWGLRRMAGLACLA